MNPAPASFHALHKTSTREAILDAVERCLSKGALDEITFNQVAQEAGVSERTVYRHFETKELMLEAFWGRIQQTLGIERSTRSWKDYLETRPEAFEQMDKRERLIRAVMQSTQAADARKRINAARQAGIRRVVADRAGKLPEPAFTELCALVHLLGSAPAWAALKDYWGIDGANAGRVVARAIATLASAATHEKGSA
ncbi:MAG TPA: TetR/AcrR family transcriptional regulator [Ramlibacter sp.]|nr:TetR/AcrR family transcriptional regulator [Ramlibacter sp.]